MTNKERFLKIRQEVLAYVSKKMGDKADNTIYEGKIRFAVEFPDIFRTNGVEYVIAFWCSFYTNSYAEWRGKSFESVLNKFERDMRWWLDSNADDKL